VKTILYIQIYTKLTIDNRVQFFSLLNTGQTPVFHTNVLSFKTLTQ